MYKYIISILLLFIFIININSQNKHFTVVLDPGHGGSDVGATREGIYESHIVLDIALLVGKMLEKHQDIKVAYTRTTDKKLLSSERMSIANKAEGDIFVSIHVNSAYDNVKKRDVSTAHGVEVYIQTVENINRKTETLKSKSAIMAVNEDGKEVLQRYDYSNNPAFNAIYEIKQAQIFNLSNNLATYIGKEMGETERNIRGVKQESFYVTWQTIVPSVLVEIGYITNLQERKFMNSKEGKQTLATGLYKGILRYKEDFDKSKESSEDFKTFANEIETQVSEPAHKRTSSQEIIKEDITTNIPQDEILFMWQVFVSSTPLKDKDYRFKNLKCSYYKDNNLYKYIYGSNPNYKEVLKMQNDIKKLFPDAFIIVMKNGKRVNIDEVRK